MIPIIQPDRQSAEIRRRKDEGLASALGQAFSGGVGGYLQGRRESQQQEKTARQLAAEKILNIQMQGIPINQEELPQIQQEAYQEALTGQQGPTLSRVLNEGFQAKLQAQQEQKALERQQRRGAIDLQNINLQEAKRKAAEATLPPEETQEGKLAAYKSRLKQDEEAAKIAGGGKITADQRKAAGFATRVKQAEDIIESIGDARATLSGAAQSMLPTAAQSDVIQRQDQAERNFINAVLRRESGAAISPSEFDSAEKQYFPRLGDSPSVIKQKMANRLAVLASLEAESGDIALSQIAERLPRKEEGSFIKEFGPSEANAAPPVFSEDEIMKELKRRGLR